MSFWSRNKCVSCSSNDTKILKKILFKDSLVQNFLIKYYGTKVKEINFNSAYLEYLICEKCSMVWQKNILSDENMKFLYDELISADYSLQKRELGDYSKFRDYISLAQQPSYFFYKSRPRDIKVLDFGMGWGHYCMASKACGFDVFGCELSLKRIKFAKLNGIKTIDKPEQIEDKFFHYINTDQVFEHLDNPINIIQFFKRIIKDKGIIKISVPNSVSAIKKLKKDNWTPTKNPLHPLEHVNCYTNKSLINFAKINGFELIFPSKNSENSYQTFFKEIIKSKFTTSLFFQKT